jgi:hypothetical protein
MGFIFVLLKTALFVEEEMQYSITCSFFDSSSIYACFKRFFIGYPLLQVLGSTRVGKEYGCEEVLSNYTQVQFRSGQWRWTILFLWKNSSTIVH